MKRINAVWSKVSEHTQPPVLQGEITISGTRTRSPYGPGTPPEPLGVPATPAKNSLSVGTVDAPGSPPTLGYGPGTWSQKPSFSSKGMIRAVLAPRSGWLVSASSTPAVYHAP